MWNPPLTDEALGTRRSPLAEAADILAELVARRRADDLLHEVAPRGRADVALRSERARGARPPGARRADRALPRRLHAAAAARARAAAGERATCSASSPPTRWSSASTSASSTRRSSSPSRARSRRCARCGAAPAAAGTGLAVYIAGEDALDQFFCRHPDEFLGPRGRGGDPRPRERPDLRRAPAVRRPRGAARRRRRGDARRRRGSGTPASSSPPASCARTATAATSPPRRGLPGRRGLAALRRARHFAVVDVTTGELIGTVEAGARVLDHPRGRDLPAHGPLLRGPDARPRGAPRGRQAVRRRLVHAAQEGDSTRHRAAARPARAAAA